MIFRNLDICPAIKTEKKEKLRDQFAMAALTGLLASQINYGISDLAGYSYFVADAMLKEREIGKGSKK